MVQPQRSHRAFLFSWIGHCTQNFRGWLVLLGLSAGLWYLPTWIGGLIDRGPQSTDGFTLATCFVGLSFYFLWRQWGQLAILSASEEDRLLGYILNHLRCVVVSGLSVCDLATGVAVGDDFIGNCFVPLGHAIFFSASAIDCIDVSNGISASDDDSATAMGGGDAVSVLRAADGECWC